MTTVPTQPVPPAAPPSATDNVMGLIGFIGSLVSFITCGILSPIALILSLIGLFKPPRGFAVAGTVLSLVGCILLLLIGLTAVGGALAAMAGWESTTRGVALQGAEVLIRDAYVANQNVAPGDAEGQALIDAQFQPAQQFLTAPRYRRVSDTAIELILPGDDEQFGTADDDVTAVDLTTPQMDYDADATDIDVEAETPADGV